LGFAPPGFFLRFPSGALRFELLPRFIEAAEEFAPRSLK